MECGIQTGVDRQIKLLCGVVCQRDTGGRCLCVVDEHVNVPEGVHCLLYHIFHNGGIVRTGVHVSLHCQNTNAVQAFQFFLGSVQLLCVPSGDDQIGTFFGIGGGNAIADRTASAVAEHSSAGTGDNGGFVGQETHNKTSFLRQYRTKSV